MELQTSVDNIKKGRVLALALIVSISILLFKVTQTTDIVNPLTVLLRAFGYFIATYVGLIWAFRLQVTLHSLLYILPQTSLFIFAEVIFLELFFFRRVGRVYEIVILLVMLVLLFFGSYVVFLMSNVFNVSTIKEIPLIQAARTVSFISTLISTFFLTLGLMDGNINIIPTFLLLLITFTGIAFFHLKHMEINRERLGEYTILTVMFMMVSVMSLAFVSQNHEIIALAPTVGAYVVIELVTKKQRNMLNLFDILQYIFLITTVFILGLIY
ncbi:hypothetical protein HYV12_00745 [Candidatus Dojkabacteria bacterium]|nr:hypothetical protein [Candidatus Dojkabacteria bacterium]